MAQGNLTKCMPVTLKYEGGLSMVRSDPGNWTGGKVGVGILLGTKYGIAAASHPEVKSIASLTEADAEAIYQRSYWAPAGCETLAAGLDLQHFDGTVNSGLGHSKAWLATAQKQATSEGSVHAYSAARLHSLESFKQWVTFGKGWAARVAGVEAAGIKMMAGTIEPSLTSSLIAAKGAAVATRAKVTGAVGHASVAVASAATVAASTGHHPYISAGVGFASIFSAIWGAFHSSVSGARAATLAQAAVS